MGQNYLRVQKQPFERLFCTVRKLAYILLVSNTLYSKNATLSAHGFTGGGSIAVQNAVTKKGYGAISAEFLARLSLLSFGFELQGVIYPEKYDQNQGKVGNLMVGFAIFRFFSLNYVTSEHFRLAVNYYPFVSGLTRGDYGSDAQRFDFKSFGITLSTDFPVSENSEQRYRIGLIYLLRDSG